MTHAARLALSVMVGLAACSHERVVAPGPLPPDGVIAVDLHTDKTQYVIGGAAKTTMVNHSPDTITMGLCNDVFERDDAAGWVEIPQPLVACPALAIIVAPGDSATLTLDLKMATTPATYRVRRQFSVVHGTTAESMYRRSNSFVMAR
jgi:hypothetical protein